MTYEYTLSEKEPDDVKAFVRQQFAQDHLQKTGADIQKYSLNIRDNSQIIASSRGSTFNKTLFISEIIVLKELRKSGLGNNLIKKIEEYAKSKNCLNIWVDTYEYQAPDFYLKNGFIEKGRIENYRGKHSRIFFEKKI